MGNHEILVGAEEYKREALKESLRRKINFLLDDGRVHWEDQFSEKIRIESGLVEDWKDRPFQEDYYDTHESTVSVYSIGEPFRSFKTPYIKKEIYLVTKSENYDTGSVYALLELDNGEMILDATNRPRDYKVNGNKKYEKREASISDLEMFDRVMDSAVSKVFGDLFQSA